MSSSTRPHFPQQGPPPPPPHPPLDQPTVPCRCKKLCPMCSIICDFLQFRLASKTILAIFFMIAPLKCETFHTTYFTITLHYIISFLAPTLTSWSRQAIFPHSLGRCANTPLLRLVLTFWTGGGGSACNEG